MKRNLFILLVGELITISAYAHDIKIVGHVSDENGCNVEYASIHVDSLYAVSDKFGNFSLVVPDDMKSDLVVNHISYEPKKFKSTTYKTRNVLQVTLKEKNIGLADVSVVSGKKMKRIVDKGVRAPGDVTFRNINNTTYEVGPIFSPNKDFFVSCAKLRVLQSSFSSCVIRLIIYEVKGNVFLPVQHRPLYIHLSKVVDKKDFTFMPEEPIKLLHSHKYYIGIAVMSSSGLGEIHFPAYFRKGSVRNLCSDKKKTLPASIGVSLFGVQIK